MMRRSLIVTAIAIPLALLSACSEQREKIADLFRWGEVEMKHEVKKAEAKAGEAEAGAGEAEADATPVEEPEPVDSRTEEVGPVEEVAAEIADSEETEAAPEQFATMVDAGSPPDNPQGAGPEHAPTVD